jgi:cycloeucalenol cycloisomerase
MNNNWFSSNSDKAWVEKFFLIYSPVWMASMAVMMLTRWDKTWGDSALLAHAIATALPVLLIPALLASRYTDKPWYDSYWLKANLYLAVFGFFGNYFGSEYFFDVLGMVYVYPNATTSLDAALLG